MSVVASYPTAAAAEPAAAVWRRDWTHSTIEVVPHPDGPTAFAVRMAIKKRHVFLMNA